VAVNSNLRAIKILVRQTGCQGHMASGQMAKKQCLAEILYLVLHQIYITSYETALQCLQDDIPLEQGNQNMIIAVLVDLSAASDTGDHKMTAKRLSQSLDLHHQLPGSSVKTACYTTSALMSSRSIPLSSLQVVTAAAIEHFKICHP